MGGVILTNADGGWLLRRPFIRKVLEVLFDGKPEALEDVDVGGEDAIKAEIAKERERLDDPAGRRRRREAREALHEQGARLRATTPSVTATGESAGRTRASAPAFTRRWAMRPPS